MARQRGIRVPLARNDNLEALSRATPFPSAAEGGLHDADGELSVRTAKSDGGGRARHGLGLQRHEVSEALGKCVRRFLPLDSRQVRDRSGKGSTYSRKGASGKNVQFLFCPQYGSTVSTSLELLPGVIGIPVGCFVAAGPEPADGSKIGEAVAHICEEEIGGIERAVRPRGAVITYRHLVLDVPNLLRTAAKTPVPRFGSSYCVQAPFRC